MKIICISNQKGGVGKTSLCLLLAYYFSKSVRTAVLDTDAQGSLSELLPSDNAITLLNRPHSWQELQSLPYDILFIDTPPYLSSDLPSIYSLADLVLIPIKAGFFDALAIKATLNLVEAAKAKNALLTAGVVLNMVKPSSTLTAEIKTLLEQGKVPLLSASLTDRVSYTRSLLVGGVMEGSDTKAKIELSALADEMLTLIGL